MADEYEVELRSDKLRQDEQLRRAKMEKKRQQQMNGFQGGGRPASASGQRRRQMGNATRQQQQNRSNDNNNGDLGGVGGKVVESDNISKRSNGFDNPAFDEPEITEVISNIDKNNKQTKNIPKETRIEIKSGEENLPKKVEDSLQIKTPEFSPRSFNDEEIEEVKIDETDQNKIKAEIKTKTKSEETKQKKIKKKEKVRAPPPQPREQQQPEPDPVEIPEKEPVQPVETQNVIRSLTREDTVLFKGDEYYEPENSQRGIDDDDLRSELDMNIDTLQSAPINPANPPMLAPDFRPASRLSCATTAESAGIENLEEFIFQPAAQDTQIKCRISRDRKGIDNRAYPVYYLHMEREGQKKVFLLAARKRKRTATSAYLISCDPTDLGKKSDSYIAKLRSNMMGTRFTCYDKGKAYTEPGALIDPDNLRRELVSCWYETNVLGFKGPRKMTITIPGMDMDYERVECRPVNERETLSARCESAQNENIAVLHNKSPVWNEDSQSYVLNFHGRVTQASVKNFQIIHEKEPDYIVMQFGRVEDDVFTMDYRYPLCAVQAFSIALSSFDNKLACE